MTTTPARLAKLSVSYASLPEVRTAAIHAYRTWYRSVSISCIAFDHVQQSREGVADTLQAPEICTLYNLHVSPSAIRLKIRQDFERNRHVQDLGIINVLLLKNQQEYQETMNAWKQEVSCDSVYVSLNGLIISQPHIMHWFKKFEDPPAPQTFLDKFYAGRDDPKQVASF